MIRYQPAAIVLPVILVILATSASTGLAGSDVPLMTVDELKARLDDPDLIILDVRQDKDWTSSDFKIRYAIYADPKSYDEWGAAYPKHQPIVLYCAWPNEYTSAGLARKMIADGYTQVYALKGGWKEWEHAGYPVEEK